MRAYAQKGDIESMYKYYVNALGDPTGKEASSLGTAKKGLLNPNSQKSKKYIRNKPIQACCSDRFIQLCLSDCKLIGLTCLFSWLSLHPTLDSSISSLEK